ncbi:MAG: 4-hydroxythreonine-4-phosphate dehydrogenase PdxA [bacterium]|nr:4-hydroxythreonine-4-phosphate dehydrogenase PdxA [bacterium]
MKPKLAITLGDVNGVGPEITLKAFTNHAVQDYCDPFVIGNVTALEDTKRLLETLPGAAQCPPLPNLYRIDSPDAAYEPGKGIPVYEAGVAAPPVTPGTLSAEAGRCAVQWLQEGVRLTMNGTIDGIVTCPLNKEGIHLAGYAYPGHTEIIAEMTGAGDYRMSLFSDRMRIVHVTAHCPLIEVAAQIRTDRIASTIRIAHDALLRLSAASGGKGPGRRIAVSGMNPHAGEAGVLGTEEMREIEPAVALCREEGIDCSGPYPPDTVFRRMWDGEFDLVVAMYHDQGHIALKLIAMDEGVNVTLGIPIVRTSVDHGTAYDIAGKGIARENSLLAALRLAALLSSKGVQD